MISSTENNLCPICLNTLKYVKSYDKYYGSYSCKSYSLQNNEYYICFDALKEIKEVRIILSDVEYNWIRAFNALYTYNKLNGELKVIEIKFDIKNHNHKYIYNYITKYHKLNIYT